MRPSRETFTAIKVTPLKSHARPGRDTVSRPLYYKAVNVSVSPPCKRPSRAA